MRIVVPLKQVPDTNNVRIDPKRGTLIREGVPSIINPEDKNALELALSVKAARGGEVIVISMGPPQAEEALREAVAMGADKAILLTDRAFAGADTLATATTLGTAIRKLGGCQLILCGRQAIDGDTAQVGPQLAENLGVPQVTYVRRLDLEDGVATVERELEDGHEVIQVKLPALFTVTKEANKPRYPHARAIMSCYGPGKLECWSLADVGLSEETVGLNGSPTKVKRTFSPQPKGQGEMLSGTKQEVVKALCRRLRGRSLL
ncbi:MAG: electron transfer flavoprotein subunit beta/FixA family protein [Bacillota bacterium]